MKMRFLLPISFSLLVNIVAAQPVSRPKLVVGLVVDQMRWDYLYRFHDRFGKAGFRRILNEGFSCENTFIPYTPTYTAAGHTCVYTGSVPALHGIMGNSWYDKMQKRVVYCTEDNTVQSVGSSSSAGKMSPRNLWSNTITDELRLATNFRSKTIALALKDRGSILPGGHTSNGSFWFDNATGGWISSTFYMQELPQWIQAVNQKKLPDQYISKGWNTLYPINTYVQSTADSNRYEGRLPGEDFVFPHQMDTITRNRYDAFRTSPFGCSYTLETAKAAIAGERLGMRGVTDFLAVSLSSPDYIGHTFGPNSIEVEDTYLRLDRELEEFLKHLDEKIGKGQYLLFLTADHGAAQNPAFLNDNRIAAGTFNHNAIRREVNDSLLKWFNTTGIVAQSINYQFYFNDSIIHAAQLDKGEIKKRLIQFLIRHHAVSNVVDLANLANTSIPPQLKMMLTYGYNQKLSGDLQVIIKPQWFESWQTGTTHGHWNPYDAHIPLLWYGWKIKPGKTNRETYMTDIAPTLAALLRIQMPNASIGKVIEEITK